MRKGAREGRREGGRSTGVPLCRDAGWMVKVCILGNKSAFYDEDFDSPEISLGESNIPPEKALKSLYSGLRLSRATFVTHFRKDARMPDTWVNG